MTDLAYRYLSDGPITDAERDDWEFFMLDCDQFDHETRYSTNMIWSKHGPEILKGWIEKHPATRPTCWWKFSSGLERRRHPEHRAIVLSIVGSIPADQRQWLADHGLLLAGE